MTKKKVTRKTTTVKTRASGTMTEAAFWSFIRSGLRQKSRWWKPLSDCKLQGKTVYQGPNKKQKFQYQCNECKGWFAEKNIEIDHIIPAGSLNCKEDLPGFVERLFCEVDGLQILCSSCHDVKTKQEKLKKI